MGPTLPDSIRISGNFGELRGNHFHSGIDYKTDEKEGKPVLAAAEGYVSRIKVSSTGYGRAVYITHPNDIVTVYGHLRIFYPALEDTIRKLQYETKDYNLEFFPDSGRYPVESGMVIGYSGNTGSSNGPHLHFETRNRVTEKPYNPEISGYGFRDSIAPEIMAIAIYHPGPFGGLAGSSKQLIERSKGEKPTLTDTVSTTGSNFFVGFEAYDKAGIEDNQLGIRAFQLFLDDSLVFRSRIDSFSFDETRYINATIDYPFLQETGRKIMLCHTLKGNLLSFFENKSGVITLKDTSTHLLKIRVEDTAGNFTESTSTIRKSQTDNALENLPNGKACLYGNAVKINTKKVRIEVNPLSFYEDLILEYHEMTPPVADKALHSAVISIGPARTPIHDPILISINPELKKSDSVSKFIAVQIDSTGLLQGIKSSYKAGWITFKTRSMGNFTIAIDTTAPIAYVPFWEPDEYSGKQRLSIGIAENLSGMESSKCYINDVWTCSVYNSRYNKITVYPEDIPASTEPLNINVELTDVAGNRGNYNFQVTLMKP